MIIMFAWIRNPFSILHRWYTPKMTSGDRVDLFLPFPEYSHATSRQQFSIGHVLIRTSIEYNMSSIYSIYSERLSLLHKIDGRMEIGNNWSVHICSVCLYACKRQRKVYPFA